MHLLSKKLSLLVLLISYNFYYRYVSVTAEGKTNIFTIKHDKAIKPGYMGFNVIQRKQGLLSIDQDVSYFLFVIIFFMY